MVIGGRCAIALAVAFAGAAAPSLANARPPGHGVKITSDGATVVAPLAGACRTGRRCPLFLPGDDLPQLRLRGGRTLELVLPVRARTVSADVGNFSGDVANLIPLGGRERIDAGGSRWRFVLPDELLDGTNLISVIVKTRRLSRQYFAGATTAESVRPPCRPPSRPARRARRS